MMGSVHPFCSPTLVVSVELQYFPVSEMTINSGTACSCSFKSTESGHTL